MTRRHHDALFKKAFGPPDQVAPLLRSLLPDEVVEAVDWATLRRENGSFIDEDLADTHADLLFAVQLGGQEARIYMLFEHQSTVEQRMVRRVLRYVMSIWDAFEAEHTGEPLPVVIPLVLSHAESGWTAATHLWDMLAPRPSELPGVAELVPRFSIHVVDLSAWSDTEIRRRALTALPRLALWALRDARRGNTLLEGIRHWGSAFTAVARSSTGLDALRALCRYIAHNSEGVPFAEVRDTILEVAPETEPAIMTIAEELRQQGIQQGIQQGRVEAFRQMLRAQLVERFGDLGQTHEAALASADEDELLRLGKRFAKADSLDAVFVAD